MKLAKLLLECVGKTALFHMHKLY